MPFFTKSEIEDRKNKILSFTRNIADLQSEQNEVKKDIERLLKEDARLQAEQNELIEEVMRLSADIACLLYTSPSPRDKRQSRMPSSA